MANLKQAAIGFMLATGGLGLGYLAFRPTDARVAEYQKERVTALIQQYNAALVKGAASTEEVACALEIGGNPAQYAIVCDISGARLTLMDRGIRIGGIESLVGQPAIASVPLQPKVK